MNAIVDANPAIPDTPSPATAQRRLYAGQGAAQPAPADYTVLLPSDAQWPRERVLRAVVADALQRNGKTVDEDTLDATVDSVAQGDGPLAKQPVDWRLQPGESRAAGQQAAPPFHGYAVPLTAAQQREWVEYATDWSAKRDAAPPVPVDASVAQLRAAAASHGASEVLRTLDAIDAAIKAGQAAGSEGQPVDAVAMRAMLEFATRMGKERDAAKILERYTALKNVAKDAKEIGQDAARVINGRDPVTGKPLNTDQRVDAALGLLSNGFQVVGQVGQIALMFGAGNSGLVAGLIGVAPAGAAIVAFAAGVYQLVKHAREKILEPQWNEFRARFPDAEGMEPKHFVTSAMRQVAGMPVDEGNAMSTSTRILALMGQNPETRERFLSFLKGKVEPDSMVDALASGKLEGLSKEQAMELARAAKGHSREFLELEIQDTKRFVKDRDGDRTRGTYLLEGQARSDAERNTDKVGGAVDEGLRIAGILTGSAQQVVGSFQDLLGTLKGDVKMDGKPLDAQQQQKLAAATAAAAATGGLTQVDSLVTSNDGSKLFAIQGDPQSEGRRMVAIDIAAGAAQSVEASNRQREAAQPQAPVHAALQQEQAQRAM